MARLSDVYWHPACFPKDFKSAASGWLPAFIQFTSGYAYERQGAPTEYRQVAHDAIKNVGGKLSSPTTALPAAIWREFLRLAKRAQVKPNWKVNPLAWPKKRGKMPATTFLLSLKADQYNILTWAGRMIREERAEEATDALLAIRGIGPKLAAFYLRDVARSQALSETPAWCFQPVDVWIRRIARCWATVLGRSAGTDDEAASLFIDLATAAGVRPGDLNAGAWVFGSQLLDGDIDDVVCRSSAFAKCLEDNRRWNDALTPILIDVTTQLR